MRQTPQSLSRLLGHLQLARFSGLFLWLLIIGIFAVWIPDTFLTSVTWKSIATTGAVTAILAIALVFPLAAGAFDLSAAQNLGFSALVCGALMYRAPHLSVAEAILLTLAVGALIGVVNGTLVSVVGLDSFIATLGTSSLIVGASSMIGHGEFVGPFPDGFQDLTTPTPFGIPIVVLYVLVLAVALWYVLEHTPAGRRIYATGANPDAARLAGVQTRKVVFVTFVVAGVGAAVAGIVLASSVNSVSETLGPEYLLPAFAAAFLGTTQLKPGRFNIWGTILAIYLLGTGVQGLQLVGGQSYITHYFNGGALILAVSIALVLERRRGQKGT